MLRKKYIFAVANEEGDSFSSLSFSKIQLILTAACLFCLFLVIVYILTSRIRNLGTEQQYRTLEKKNETLMRTFKTWETRVQKLESSLKDVQRRNHQLRATAFLSMPDVEYGVGGSDSPLKMGIFEFPETQSVELDLDKIDKQISALQISTAELENTLSKKTMEIAHYPSIQPVRGGWLSSSYGKRIDPFTGKIEDHPGIDISIRPGTEVYASGAGTVKEVNLRVIPNKGYGIYIVIDHGFGYESLYGHLSKVFVRKGQQVKRWDLIGLSGDTGKSTAPHLHYMVTVKGDPKNPRDFLLEEYSAYAPFRL